MKTTRTTKGDTTIDRIDRLIIKAQDQLHAQNGGLTAGLIAQAAFCEEPQTSPNYNKWELVAYIGTDGSTRPERITSYWASQEEALAEWERLEREYPPRGKNAKKAALVIMDGEDKL